MAGIYIHIPFCRKLCGYCDFFKSISLAKKEQVLDAIGLELQHEIEFLGKTELTSIYIGGGTPSVCSPGELQKLFDLLATIRPWKTGSEITLEANPDDLSPAYLKALRTTPINRLSIGIQSLHDDELRFMNRRHTATEAIRAVKEAQDAGFEDLSIDLIYGIPVSDTTRWENTLDRALALDATHISAYHLTIEPHTLFGRKQAAGELTAVDETVSEKQYALLHDKRTEAGYEHYEISNFARPGYRARHNSAYWHGAPYLGVGPSAHSYDGSRRRRWSDASLGRYLAGPAYTEETLTDDDLYNEFIMTRLRCAEGIDPRELEVRFGACKLQRFLHSIQRFVETDTMRIHNGNYAIPPERFLLSDAIIAELFV